MRTDSNTITSEEDKELGVFGVMIGLLTEPYSTVSVLLKKRYPPYAITLFAFLLLAVFGPILHQYFVYHASAYRLDAVLGIGLIFGFSVLTFIVLETLMLTVIGLDVSLPRIAASVSYSLSPLSFVVILLYTFNYFDTGRISLISYLLSGTKDPNDPFMMVLPWAIGITCAIIIVVFYYCLRIVAELFPFTGWFTLLFSAVPALAAVWIGLRIGEEAIPGTTQMVYAIITHPGALTYFSN